MIVTSVQMKKGRARRQADSPATRTDNLTRFWRVVRRHPTIPDDVREVRACVVGTLVGDLTIPEGSRLERDTPLYLRVAGPATLHTAVPPGLRRVCEQDLALPTEELTRRPTGLYLRQAGVYLTLLYPGLHDCGLGLESELLALAFCAVLRTGHWRAGLDVLLEPVRRATAPRPTRAAARAVADLWEAHPAERVPRRLHGLGAAPAPAATLAPLATPELRPRAGRSSPSPWRTVRPRRCAGPPLPCSSGLITATPANSSRVESMRSRTAWRATAPGGTGSSNSRPMRTGSTVSSPRSAPVGTPSTSSGPVPRTASRRECSARSTGSAASNST
jgi:hypothetical protein